MRLRLLTEADLSLVAHWFDDAAIQEWLGGRDWLPRELRLVRQRPGTLFRRQLVLRSYAWLALADGRPVGYAGGDIYDRWTQTFDGYPHRSMGISYLVDPAEQGRGIGRALVRAVVTRADLVDVHTFWAGSKRTTWRAESAPRQRDSCSTTPSPTSRAPSTTAFPRDTRLR